MGIGAKIRHLREVNDMTLKELANKAGISLSYLGDIEKGRSNPSVDTLKSLAVSLNKPASYFIDDRIDILDILEDREIDILSLAGKPLTQDQRLSIIRVLDNSYGIKSIKIPILGQIKMGVPILAQDNWDGELEIPSDIRADFALETHGDSMIGVGLLDGDYAVCRESQTARNGDIVVGIQRTSSEISEATLKFYFKEKNKQILRAANPNYEDIEMDEEWRIGGVLVGIIRKDSPSYRIYNSYLAARDISEEKWDPVFEKASQLGIEPSQVMTMLETMYHVMKKS